MAQLNFNNRWVLVTGASSGLGREIARRMAVHEKANLVIAARRTERLEELKKEIEASCAGRVEVIAADLSRDEDVENLFDQAVAIAPIYAVVNNAGITDYGKCDVSRMEKYEKIIQVNFKALLKLSLKFVAYFLERGEGALQNVTSMGGMTPLPYQGIYSAAKHAAQAFSEALQQEYKREPIVISTFSPGGIATEMITLSGLDKKHPLDSPFNMTAEAAAKKAVAAFKKKKSACVPGMTNKITIWLTRLLPRKLIAWASELVYRPPA